MKCLLSLVAAALALNLATGAMLAIKVDDELQLFVDGAEKVNAFKEPGWQWQKVYSVDVPDNFCVLAARMFNVGGPGDAVAELNGRDLSTAGWKCKAFNEGQNPDTLFPGWNKCDFNDGAWGGNTLIPDSSKQSKGGNMYWWGASQSAKNVVCRLTAPRLTIRVDDEVKVFGDKGVFLDTFKIPGPQWQITNKVSLPLDTEVLTLKVHNIGGPGNIECNIDGVNCKSMSWKCKSIAQNQDPEQAYPGVTSATFNDADWEAPVSLNGNKFWAGPQSNMNAVCRTVLSPKLTIRVDDEVKVFADKKVVLDTFKMAGPQWQSTFAAKLPRGTKVLTLKVHNIGGPGNIECNIDGKDCKTFNWKCKAINFDQEPEQAFPGVTSATSSFSTAGWSNLVALPMTREMGAASRWWAGPQNLMTAVCRVELM